MDMARRLPAESPPPLLVWRERSAVEALERECRALALRIARLKPHSHYRLELEARLRGLRCQQIRLECEMRGRQ